MTPPRYGVRPPSGGEKKGVSAYSVTLAQMA